MKQLRSSLLIITCLLFLFACSTPQAAVQTIQPLTAVSNTSVPIIPSPSQTIGDDFSIATKPIDLSLATSTPEPTPTAAARKSVMVIIFDGGQAQMVYQAMDAGELPHFNELARQGVRAEYAQSVDPPVSAPAHAALASGAYPDLTGILSNAFHDPSDDFYWYRVGFEVPYDQAEPVWVTAQRAGFTTAALFMGGATPQFPKQMADYTIGYGIRDAYSNQVTVPLATSGGWANTPTSYSPPLEGYFYIPSVARVDLMVLDGSDDRQTNYDTVLLNSVATGKAQVVTGDTLSLELAEWGPLTLLPNITAGADFLVQEITPSNVKLYYTGVYHNMAAPRPLLEALNQRFGFFPAGPDDYALDHGWITADDYLELLKRSANWMAEVSAWVFETYKPDILYTWQDGFDATNHNFLLVDPRQAGFSPELSQQYSTYRQRAEKIADQTLETMLKPVDLNETSVFVTSDHGMAPVHTDVYVNTILQRAGLLRLDRRNYVNVKTTKALAVVTGGSVNIYVNLKGREKDGIVAPEEYPQIQAQIVELLGQLLDPNSSEPAFQRILTRQELANLHLDHSGVGDIFAQAAIGYNLDDYRGKGVIFEPSKILGNHGYDSALPEMQAFFIAAGAQIPDTGSVIPPLKIVDLAPTIAGLLGFEPAPGIAGSPIPAITNP